MYKKSLLSFAVVALLAGCGHVTGGVAPSNIPLAVNSYIELGQALGEDCHYNILGIIPANKGNETKDALAEALKVYPDTTALINITADTYGMHFILFSKICTQVHGTAVKTK